MRRFLLGMGLAGLLMSGCGKQEPKHVLADDIAFRYDGAVTRHHDRGFVEGTGYKILVPAEEMKYHYFIENNLAKYDGSLVHSAKLGKGDLYWKPNSFSDYTEVVAIASNEISDHPLMHIGDMNNDGVVDYIRFNRISSRELEDRFSDIAPREVWDESQKIKAFERAGELFRRVKRDVTERNPTRSLD